MHAPGHYIVEFHGVFGLDLKHFGCLPNPDNVDHLLYWTRPMLASNMCAKGMDSFCRKVVLSNSLPCPAVMLITGTPYGFVAFATAEGGAWRLAR